MNFQLRIVSGPRAGATVLVTPGAVVSIGRGADATLSVPEDNTLSRAHAEVVQQGGQWVIVNKSQHGSFMNGEVFQDQRPLAPGVEFQVGAVRVVFEVAPAGASAPSAGGAPQAGGGAGAAAAAALGSLPAGPSSIDGSQPGIPLGDVVKGGLGVVKANLVPSVLLFAVPALATLLSIAVQVLAALDLRSVVGILALVSLGFSLLQLLWALTMPLLGSNYMAGVKRYQETGERFGIGALFDFENFLGKYLTNFLSGLGFVCCCIPGILFLFAVPVFLDNPALGPVGAIKGSLAWTKRNLVPAILLVAVIGVLNIVGGILCGVGLAVTLPASLAAVMLTFLAKKSEFLAAMAEDGISA
ncbi:MAG: FHA domain-containing protein [Planctomycetota bacterium]|nr:MAG: FHA domain-containing protein [Planctomycetota bacterium]